MVKKETQNLNEISEDEYRKTLLTSINDHYQRQYGPPESGQVEQLTSEALLTIGFERNLEARCIKPWDKSRKNRGWIRTKRL